MDVFRRMRMLNKSVNKMEGLWKHNLWWDLNAEKNGYFFHDNPSIQGQESDELLLDSPVLSTGADPPYRKINTAWAIILEMIVIVAVEVSAIILPLTCGTRCSFHPDSIIVYIHGGLWFVMLVLDRVYRSEHHTSRMAGYLEFYRRTKNLRRLPLLINSGANAVLLIILEVLYRDCMSEEKCAGIKKYIYLQIIISLETVSVLVLLGWYLATTLRFNKNHASPDVAQEEMMASMQSSVSSEVGFRSENYKDQILEKQADMIRYLKEHNSQLCRRVLTLTDENQMLKTTS